MANALTEMLFTVYGAPDSANPEGYIAILDDVLRGYDDEVLTEAAQALIRAHRYKSWPTPGECVAAASKAGQDKWVRENEPRLRAEARAQCEDELQAQRDKNLRSPEVNALVEKLSKEVSGRSSPFAIIQNRFRRAGPGATIDMRRPHGEEVHDAKGKVVPPG